MPTVQPEANGKIMVTVACGSVEAARQVARAVVEKRLAACVQIVPQVESVYWWKGEVESSTEALLLIKTVWGKWEALCSEIRRVHSYEVPEVLAFSVEAGLPEYLGWMDRELADDGPV